MTTISICGTNTSLCKVLDSIASSGGVNETALTAAKDSVTTAIEPVKNEIVSAIENVVYVMIFLIIVGILIPLIIAATFLGRYYTIEWKYIGLILLIATILFLVVAYIIGSSLLNEIITEVNNRYDNFINGIDSATVLDTLNTAAAAYNAAAT